jgi:hypothetical protein
MMVTWQQHVRVACVESGMMVTWQQHKRRHVHGQVHTPCCSDTECGVRGRVCVPE